ncbi:MAG: glycosyltransferase family 39 protein [Candidatus Rokubacteria bacterium]|nr:glycosyltransferase family 39 protein [Candidatus Rokubacteria bacterium]
MTALTLFAGALGARLLALAAARATGRFPEFWEYETIARSLIAGDGFVYAHMGLERSAYVEPLYPFVIAGAYLATGASSWALAAVQVVASAALAPVTYAFARRTFGARAGVAAGALVAVDPGLVG